MTLLIVFILGLIFGSFANVVLLRYNTGESLMYYGSRCFSCGRRLSWFELIPVFSYIFLLGKCRTCKSKISFRYPLVELGTGILFVFIFFKIYSGNILAYGDIYRTISYFLHIILLVGAWYLLWLASLYDMRHKILPDFFTYGAFFLAFISVFFSPSFNILNYSVIFYALLVGAGLFLFFFLLSALSRGRWMGMGDAKFVLSFGFFFPPSAALLALVFSFWFGAVFGIFMLFLRKFNIKDEIPFGPFLFLGAITAFLFWEKIIFWYFSLF